MSRRRLLTLSGLVLLSGCLYHVRERTDQVVGNLAAHPFDLGPAETLGTTESRPADEKAPMPRPAGGTAPGAKTALPPAPALDVQTTAFMQEQAAAPAEITARLKIPDAVPGSETPLIQLPKDPAARKAAMQRLYPELEPLQEVPKAQPGPDGQPYTLASLQQLAAANSPTLLQAAADVEAARGNFIQAALYPNPTVSYQATPSNDGSTPGLQGFGFDQVIKTTGKLKLAQAAAKVSLDNAELALKRARSDLATAVRNAYYALLVAQETVRVNRALARFTDEVYRIQADLMATSFAAGYEPAGLRAQAYITRLAYEQALQSYLYAWKQLVATVGLRQLPLSEVAGRIDRAIPYYDYDAVLAHVLHNHTDALIARNAADLVRYNFKLAQITPYPDVEVSLVLFKEFALPPKQVVPSVTTSIPLPIWDRNKGNIIAAEAALARASEEPHRVETTLTNNLAAAYATYKNNLAALESYRKYVLPDQVRYYRGVYDRRRIDPNSAFGDLVTAQQTLVANVTTYLGILGSLWTSVTGVADFLQTDDLFQLGQPHELPPLPDLAKLPPWLCTHAGAAPVEATPACAGSRCPAVPDGVSGAVKPDLAQGTRLPLLPPPEAGRLAAKPVRPPWSPDWVTGSLPSSPSPAGEQQLGPVPGVLPQPSRLPPAVPPKPGDDLPGEWRSAPGTSSGAVGRGG